jgi:hypothetical protein
MSSDGVRRVTEVGQLQFVNGELEVVPLWALR